VVRSGAPKCGSGVHLSQIRRLEHSADQLVIHQRMRPVRIIQIRPPKRCPPQTRSLRASVWVSLLQEPSLLTKSRPVPATGEVQVHDIIRSFQLGSETPIDVETTPKTQNEWWNEMIKLREKCSQSKPLTITFFRGLKIGPVSNEKEFVFKLAGQKGEDAMGFVQCKKSPTIIGVGKGGLAETLGVRADDVILGFRIKDEDWVDTHQKHWRTKFDEYRTKAINDVRNGGEFTMKIRDTKDLLRTPKRRRLSQLDRLVRELQLASSME